MTDPTLVSDLQSAKGPSRELDARVAVALSLEKHTCKNSGNRECCLYYGSTCSHANPRIFTASVDSCLEVMRERLPGATFTLFSPPGFSPECTLILDGNVYWQRCRTEPLALTAAIVVAIGEKK